MGKNKEITRLKKIVKQIFLTKKEDKIKFIDESD